MSGPDPSTPLGRAGQALRFWEGRQAVAANNLANVNTTGFKGEHAFARLLDEAALAVETRTDHRVGSFTPTGRSLDVALQSDGFFMVQTPRGDRLTRSGSFQILGDVLTDATGNPVMGHGGAIHVPPGRVEFTREGTILVDGVVMDRLRVVEPLDPRALEHQEGSLFRAGATPLADLAPERISMAQGALEESNVNPIEAMVEMLEVRTSHQSVERTLRVLDDVLATITTRLGRVS